MLVRSNNLTQSVQDSFHYDHLNQTSFGNHAEMQNYNQTRLTQSYSTASIQSPCLVMPIIHESNDLLNCDLTQLQNMDDDEDYVDHDLGDSDDELESDDDEDEESDCGQTDSEESSNFDNEKPKTTKNKKSKRNQPKELEKLQNLDTINNSTSHIEKNFVTICQKDEISSKIQNGILHFFFICLSI